MDDREREHPDEGTIHAWLDGALDDDASRALEAHVAACRACAERVAEARGLIAGASRIVSALDDAPSGAGPAWGQVPVAAVVPPSVGARRWWRVTPTRAAIAATVLVAVGVSLTYDRVAVDSEASRVAPATRAADSTMPVAAAPTRDPLLDSAVKRNVAEAQPPRAVGPAPGPALPVPERAPANVLADPAAPTRVAAARAAIRAEREVGAAAAPDQLAGRASGVARAAEDRAVAAATRADSVTAQASKAAPGMAAGSSVQPRPELAPLGGAECYRVESANGVAATWGVEPLPLIVRVDSGGRAAMFTVAGQPTTSQVAITRAGDDSLLLRLRRIGYEGTLALGAPGEARAGVMRSRPAASQLQEMVTTATGAEEPSPARRRMPVAKQARPPQAPAPAAADASTPLTAEPAVPVVARRTGCPR